MKRYISLILALLLIFNLFGFEPFIDSYAAGTLSIEKVVSKTTVAPGEVFTYTIKYRNASTEVNGNDVIIEDVLPANLEYVSHVDSQHVSSSSHSNNTVTFNMASLAAGSTGVLKISARFKDGKTEDGETADNTATIDDTDIDPISSNTVTVTADVNDPDWTVSKDRVIPGPAVSPTLDSNVSYKIVIDGNSSGGFDMENVQLIDTYPENAEVVDADGGTVDTDAHTITWDIGDLPVTDSTSKTVVLKYNSTDFELADTISNEAKVTGNVYNDLAGTFEITNTDSHGFAIATPGIGNVSKSSRQANDEYSIGQTVKYSISDIYNSGNVALDNFVIVDTVPPQIDVTEVTTGKFNETIPVTISYKTDLNDYREWGSGLNTGTNTSLDLGDLSVGLVDDEYITHIKWDYGTVNPGFVDETPISVQGIIITPDNEDNAIDVDGASNTEITNSVTISEDGGLTQSANVSVDVVKERPWIVASKRTTNGGSYLDDDTIQFELKLTNHEYATGDLTTPIIVEKYPQTVLENYSLISAKDADGVDVKGSIDISNATFGDYVYYTYKFTGEVLEPGESVTVTIEADFIDTLSAGNYENVMYGYIEDSFKSSATVTDTNINDGAGTDWPLVESKASIYNIFVGALDSEKWIQGTISDEWSRFTTETLNYAETTPGGDVNYQIIIKNDNSNGPVSNIKAIDRFPFVGDKGLIDTSNRNSTWKPYLVDEIVVLDQAAMASKNQAFVDDNAGVTIASTAVDLYYTTDANPDLSILDNSATEAIDTDVWKTTPPEDITSVTHILLDFGDFELDEDNALVVEWPMRAPIGAPSDIITWNSFAFGATYPDLGGDEQFLSTEPIKVGHIIKDDPQYTLGDRVWLDEDKDGIQDADEPGINGVRVNLYLDTNGNGVLDPTEKDDDSELLAFTVTGDHYDSNEGAGYYGFPDLSNGDYIVEFVVSDNLDDENGVYFETSKDSTGDDLDSDGVFYEAAGGNHIYYAQATINNSDNPDVDLGLYHLGSIGDYVWKDLDVDGKQDSSEDGVAGLTVTLLDKDGNNVVQYDTDGETVLSPSYSVTTDADGKYLFENLHPGEYIVEFNKSLDYYWTSQNTGNGGSTNDSDADDTNTSSATSRTDVVTLKTGEDRTDIDAGFHKGYLGDYVWEDLDRDGIQDGGESGIKDIVVKLYKSTDLVNPIATDTTDNSGKYHFDDLDDTDGFTYVIVFEKTDDYLYTQTGQGTTDTDSNVSDISGNLGTVSGITISGGEKDVSIDVGLYKFGTIGDKVWLDSNGNGLQDGGEAGVANVSVELFNDEGVSIGTTVTAANGTYSFTHLIPDDYYVEFDISAVAVVDGFTDQDVSADNLLDSDVDIDTGISETYGLSYGETYSGLDAGLIIYSSLGDYVWEDVDGDGIQEVGESGIENIKVSLMRYIDGVGELVKDDSDNVIYKYTDASGNYLFEDLRPGEYQVIFEDIPISYVVTDKEAGGDRNLDSDVNSNGQTDKFTLNGNSTDLSIDMGLYHTTSIGDFVWEDLNVNGIQDVDEPGIEGVTVRLLNADDSDNVLETTTTNPSGQYLFEDLAVGNYKVEIDLPATYIVTTKDATTGVPESATDSDLDDVTLKTEIYTLHSEENIRTVDIGLYRLASLGDTIFEDLNGNGIMDDDESGIAGITVILTKPDDSTESVVTDASGNYEFTDLVPGLYDLEITVPAEYAVTLKNVGADDDKDSDFDPVTGQITDYELFSGETIVNLDGGLYKPCEVGNYVWVDSNKDGIQDDDELPLMNIKVELLDSDGNLLETAVTDALGEYLFDDLIPGTYSIKFYPAGRYYLTEQDAEANSNDEKDSDADTSTYETVQFTLSPEESNMTFDAGFYYVPKKSSPSEPEELPVPEIPEEELETTVATLSLGDYVWFDENGNGTQDSDEVGVVGITVNLLKSGVLIDSTKTNSGGQYLFDGLEAGSYKVEFIAPEGYKFTDKNQGNDNLDSDVSSSGVSSSVNLGEDEKNLSIDAGLIKAIVVDIDIEDINTGIPIEDAQIVVTDEEGDIIDTVSVGEDGKIKVEVPSNEKIKLVIVGEGYQEEEIFVDIFEDDIPLNVDLTNLPPQGVLPNTGTPYHNILLLGLILTLLGLLGIHKFR